MERNAALQALGGAGWTYCIGCHGPQPQPPPPLYQIAVHAVRLLPGCRVAAALHQPSVGTVCRRGGGAQRQLPHSAGTACGISRGGRVQRPAGRYAPSAGGAGDGHCPTISAGLLATTVECWQYSCRMASGVQQALALCAASHLPQAPVSSSSWTSTCVASYATAAWPASSASCSRWALKAWERSSVPVQCSAVQCSAVQCSAASGWGSPRRRVVIAGQRSVLPLCKFGGRQQLMKGHPHRHVHVRTHVSCLQIADGYLCKYLASCVALLVYASPLYLTDPAVRDHGPAHLGWGRRVVRCDAALVLAKRLPLPRERRVNRPSDWLTRGSPVPRDISPIHVSARSHAATAPAWWATTSAACGSCRTARARSGTSSCCTRASPRWRAPLRAWRNCWSRWAACTGPLAPQLGLGLQILVWSQEQAHRKHTTILCWGSQLPHTSNSKRAMRTPCCLGAAGQLLRVALSMYLGTRSQTHSCVHTSLYRPYPPAGQRAQQ